MAKPLKDIYTSPESFKALSLDMKKAYPSLDESSFYDALLADLDSLELMARIERIADVCAAHLPKDYEKALKILYRFAQDKENSFIYLFLPSFVAKYGQGHYDRSVKAMRDFTEYSSSEMGIRMYIQRDVKQTLRTMLKWTRSDNVHIRRLASEGSRPRLPWAKKIPELIECPKLTWPILEALKEDPEKYVQKSVANHMNDISKDHSEWLLEQIQSWDLKHPMTSWIVNHGLRTLIKQGDKGALKLFGYHRKPLADLVHVKWDKSVAMGDEAVLTLDLVSTAKKEQKLLIDYQIFFKKTNGDSKPKTFKCKKISLKAGESFSLKLKYRFKDMSTRKHYLGPHKWAVLINGEVLGQYGFEFQK